MKSRVKLAGEGNLIRLKTVCEREEWIGDWHDFAVMPRKGELLRILWSNEWGTFEVTDVVHQPVIFSDGAGSATQPEVTVFIKRSRKRLPAPQSTRAFRGKRGVRNG